VVEGVVGNGISMSEGYYEQFPETRYSTISSVLAYVADYAWAVLSIVYHTSIEVLGKIVCLILIAVLVLFVTIFILPFNWLGYK